MKWVSMVKQPQISLGSPCAMPRVGWYGVKLAATGLWSCGNAFSGVMNHASPSGSLTAGECYMPQCIVSTVKIGG